MRFDLCSRQSRSIPRFSRASSRTGAGLHRHQVEAAFGVHAEGFGDVDGAVEEVDAVAAQAGELTQRRPQ